MPNHERDDFRDDVAAGVSRGILNREQSNAGIGLLLIECCLVALAAGFMSASWWIGGGVLIVTFVLFALPVIGTIMAFLVSLLWGVIALQFTVAFLTEPRWFDLFGVALPAHGAPWVVGAIVTFIALSLHLAAFD